MSRGLRLGEYATTPLYNIKAVVQATSISPSTLRAWERRYNIARPQRSESGYRLYSERDIAIIRWLKTQVDAGMSISQAVSWLEKITADAGAMDQVILPVTGSGAPLHDPLVHNPLGAQPTHAPDTVRTLSTLQRELILALMQFDEEAAENAIAEAFALYPVEQVGDKLFIPALLEISEQRKQSNLGLTTENFANNYLIQRLGTLLRATPNGISSPLIWVGCARTELHEASALLLGIYLRRSGYHVHYLGHNIPVEEEAVQDLVREARRHQPAMILFCASTSLAAKKLGQLSSRLTETNHLPAIIGYSGSIYVRNPELRATTAGVYIGTHAHEVVQNINELLADKHLAPKKHGKKGYINKTVADRIAATNR